jgi:hypothetical protein
MLSVSIWHAVVAGSVRFRVEHDGRLTLYLSRPSRRADGSRDEVGDVSFAALNSMDWTATVGRLPAQTNDR